MHLGKPQKCSRKIGSQSKKESSSERQMAKPPFLEKLGVSAQSVLRCFLLQSYSWSSRRL